ncbi:hypothetical protein [Mycobacterium intracellulare]|uniref:zinc finger domain-containing protein n=1 Tax=Mycobacterium intracellulare TaxID=1767 RepID=UPI000A8DDF73|nr:hypothetical protein [Mycobacterium intracellulare]
MSNVIKFRPRKLPPAYYFGRMSEDCPNCGAAPGDPCRRAEGLNRRMPCLMRLRKPTVGVQEQVGRLQTGGSGRSTSTEERSE